MATEATSVPPLRIPSPEVNFVGALDGKVIAVTGSGRGIGRAVALGAAAEGAAVVVNDYGVSIDGNEPTSEVADAVVAGDHRRRRSRRRERAVGHDDGRRRVDRAAGDRHLRPHRRRRLRRRHPARADALQHVGGGVGPGHRDPPQGHLHRLPRRRAGVPRAEERHDDRLHVRRVRGERRAGQLLRRQGRHRLARPQRRGRHVQVRRDRELHRAGREVAHVGQRAVRASRWASRKTSRRWSCFLLSDSARDVTGQVYTVNGGRVAVWNQPVEVREIRKDGRWTVDGIAARFGEVGQEPMPILERLKEMEAAAKSGEKPNQ